MEFPSGGSWFVTGQGDVDGHERKVVLAELLPYPGAHVDECLCGRRRRVDADVDVQLPVAKAPGGSDDMLISLRGDLGDPIDRTWPHDGRSAIVDREAELAAGEVGPRQRAQHQRDEEQ